MQPTARSSLCLCAFVLAMALVALPAQGRLSPPDTAARAHVQAQLLDVLAQAMVRPRGPLPSGSEVGNDGLGPSGVVPPPRPTERLLELANDPARLPALRYELYEQAMRVACEDDDLAAGLRVADAMAAAFVVAPRAACLARFEAAARLRPQGLVEAQLDTAARAIGAHAGEFAAALAAARRIAAIDRPPGLRDYTQIATAELEQAGAARARLGDEPDPARLARFRAFYRGDWQGLLTAPLGDDREARILRNKIEAHGPPPDIAALARVAEQWLSQSQHEADSLAQRHLRRRAMQLLLPMARYRAPLTEPPTPPLVAGIEVERAMQLLERVSATAVQPVVGSLRFVEPVDLEGWRVEGGAWRVEGGLLLGLSRGAEVTTRATSQFAWRRIDCVTIRGGIQSAAGLNFRVAVGSVNVLFNWEVADQNHFFFRDAAGVEHSSITAPRLLRAGIEHTIVMRQCDEEVVVFVDGHEVAHGRAQLGGTVCVYPAVGSEIFVRSIDIVGDVELGRVVEGPDWTR